MTPSPTRPRIAIVVSDEALLNALAFALEADGMEAAAFRTPAEFLASSPELHCLLVDHRFAEMDGLALISAARNRSVTAPAVVIAGKPDAAFRRRAAEAGVSIVEKPLVGDELQRQVRAAVGDAD